MATTPSFVQINEGTGKKLAHATYTENGQVVYDQKVIPGEVYLPSYIAAPTGTPSSAVAGDDFGQLMAGATLNVRVRRIRFEQITGITAVNGVPVTLIRLTTAGTGGTAFTIAKMDNADAAPGATAASSVPNATHGTAGQQIFLRNLFAVTAAAPTGSQMFWEWVAPPGAKPLIIPAGITNGIALRNVNARAGATFSFEIEFTETLF